LILLPILSLTAAAQTPVANHAPASNWDKLKMLAPGTQVRVDVGTAKPTVGALKSVTDGELVLMQGTGPQSFPRPQIVSVSVRKSGHRLRNALIGLGVGLVAGAAIALAVAEVQAHTCNTFLCGLVGPVDAAIGGVSGLVGGTLAGAFWPIGWRKIYAP
jgi:hypothetical protein